MILVRAVLHHRVKRWVCSQINYVKCKMNLSKCVQLTFRSNVPIKLNKEFDTFLQRARKHYEEKQPDTGSYSQQRTECSKLLSMLLDPHWRLGLAVTGNSNEIFSCLIRKIYGFRGSNYKEDTKYRYVNTMSKRD